MKRNAGFCIALVALSAIACAVGAAPAVTVTPPVVPVQPTEVTSPVAPAQPTEAAPPAPTEALPLVYYYFASIPSGTFPAGSVVIVPDALILSPTLSDQPRSADPATNVQAALQAAINDPRNAWTSSDLTITSVTFDERHVTVVLSGDVSGVGDVVLIAARMQFLMTVFAEPAVQTATVTLNGDSLANLGISQDSQAQPANHVFTRSEIEDFMVDNALN